PGRIGCISLARKVTVNAANPLLAKAIPMPPGGCSIGCQGLSGLRDTPEVFTREGWERSMAYRVVMLEPVMEATPVYIRQEARLRFEEIAEGVENIPQDSAFWESVRVSRLCLVVRGWAFF